MRRRGCQGRFHAYALTLWGFLGGVVAVARRLLLAALEVLVEHLHGVEQILVIRAAAVTVTIAITAAVVAAVVATVVAPPASLRPVPLHLVTALEALVKGVARLVTVAAIPRGLPTRGSIEAPLLLILALGREVAWLATVVAVPATCAGGRSAR